MVGIKTVLGRLGDQQQIAETTIPEIEIMAQAFEATVGMNIVAGIHAHHLAVEDNHTKIVTARVIGVEAIVAAAALGEASSTLGMRVANRVMHIPSKAMADMHIVCGLQITAELRVAYHVHDLEDIRVIRDRQTTSRSTELSRQLGFLRFRTIEESRDFVTKNQPAIYFYGPSAGPNDRSTKVRIAYSREREDRARPRGESDWTCRMCAISNYSTRGKCFKCNAPRPEMATTDPFGAPAPRVANLGDTDAAPENQPSQFLLLRGLDPAVTEQLLGKGVAKLYRPSGSNETAPNDSKGPKVTSTSSTLGAREGSIRRVLLVRDRKTNESWGYGFAEFAGVADAQAAMARLKSFEKFTISSKPVLVTFIHAGVFIPVLSPSASTDAFTFTPLHNKAMRLMYWDDKGYVTELTLTAEEDDLAQPNPQTNQTKGTKDTEKAKKRKADAATNANPKKLAMPTQLQFWSNRHAELHGISNRADENTPGATAGANPAQEVQSYADYNKVCCWLCMRQLRNVAKLRLHERASELHRANLQNKELTDYAMYKLIKHELVKAPEGYEKSTIQEYRDRAKERRQALGPKVAAPSQRAAPREEPEAPVQTKTTSKGASLLGKMGWSEGTGLGAQGTGVIEPIATEIYAQGVGLGAQGGKLGDATEEAGRNTRGRYDEFLEKTRNTARQRFEEMDRS
ncbi:hypothetical protein N7541_004652 [Penicillium brevicompactum]|uniref:Uncharacterized protein n=1 Tax=Penicillium brevicompactum TaxID=5074 RepID=A0A9W9RDW5_PENBR|nr:hypothetical protein N7541_004652 [Penicillium brevicompactum]